MDMESPDKKFAIALAKWQIIQKREMYDQQKIIQHIDRIMYVTKQKHNSLEIYAKRTMLEEMTVYYENFIKRYDKSCDEICNLDVEIEHYKTELRNTLQLVEKANINMTLRHLVERAILPELPQTSDTRAQKRQRENNDTVLCEPDTKGSIPSLEMIKCGKTEETDSF